VQPWSTKFEVDSSGDEYERIWNSMYLIHVLSIGLSAVIALIKVHTSKSIADTIDS
jgi:hypothetical protein